MITINTILDMRPGAVPKIIHLSQYDSDFSLVFRLHASFGTLNIESGTTAEIRGTKKSGTGYSASATLNTTNNTVTVAGDAQMTAVAGQNIYEIVLTKNNKVLGSANFILLVERAALDADTITDATVLRNLEAIVEGAETATQAAEDAEDAADRAEAAAESLEIDDTLTQTGQAADAKATGDAIAGLEDEISQIVPGLSSEAKEALLACFEHVAWIDEHGQDYYDALESALYSDVDLVRIEAVFVQGQNVFTSSDHINDLKPFLTVTAYYSDGTSEVVDGYVLSGDLTDGTATITVTYEGKTTTFAVTVFALPSGYVKKSYVEADGTQYITTNISEPEENWWYRYKVSISQYSNKANHMFSSENMYIPFFVYYTPSGYKSVNMARYGTTKGIDFDFLLNTEYEVEAFHGSDDVYVNNQLVGTGPTPGTTKLADRKFAIMTYGGNLSNAQWRLRGKLFGLKIFNSSDHKVHDFVPCRNASNVAGLYDAVTGTFYAPIGTLNTD